MGVIKKCHSEEYALLNAEHLIGRNSLIVHTVISQKDVSKSHGTIFWGNGIWNLRDHSRNGTLINGQHRHQETLSLKKGTVMQFGSDPETKWELIDSSPPTSYLRSTTHQNRILSLMMRDGIPFPDDDDISFYFTGDHRWRAEQAGKVIDLQDGTTLNWKDEAWVFVENDIMDDTEDYGVIVSSSYFRIELSADEERITVKVMGKDWALDLGERVHHYLLLALVRKRLLDRGQGYASADQGWLLMETLMKDMSKEFLKEVDEYQVNLQIHRLRKQLVKLQPYGYLFSSIIERRRGELRFAHKYFQIVKEGEVLAAALPKTQE